MDKKIHLNSASPEEIASIHGLGEKRAKEIIDHRPYTNWEDFKNKLPGFSDKHTSEIKEKADL